MYFIKKQRCATRNAGLITGIEALRILNEPIASAFVYEFITLAQNKTRRVLIPDFDRGTFDVTLLVHHKKM